MTTQTENEKDPQRVYEKETQRVYDSVLEDVIKKLNEQSANGLLQMSESEIITLKKMWKDKLEELRLPVEKEPSMKKQLSISKPQGGSKRASSQIEQFEITPTKKIKSQQQEEAIIKEEMDRFKNNCKIEKVDVEDDEDVEFKDDQSEDIKNENTTRNNKQVAIQSIERFHNANREKDREKTIFDKVKEIKRQQEEALEEHELENDREPSAESNKSYKLHIYAQKVNKGVPDLSRIKPNKSQKASLENVLFKEGHRDQFVSSAVITFNFKNDLKQK